MSWSFSGICGPFFGPEKYFCRLCQFADFSLFEICHFWPNSFLATPTIEIPAVHPPNRAVGITQNPAQKFAMQWQAASEGSDGSWHVLFAPILSGPKSGLSPMPAWRNRLSAHFCQNPDFPILLGFLGALFDVIFSLFEIAHFGQTFGPLNPLFSTLLALSALFLAQKIYFSGLSQWLG